MNIDDKLLDNYATLSKQALAIASLICVASFYLIQRSLTAFLDESYALGLLGGQSQFLLHGLNFSYLTMSVIWPLVLGLLCRAYMFLVMSKARLRAAMQPELDKSRINFSLLDSSDLALSQAHNDKWLKAGFEWLPFCAVFSHLIAFGDIYASYFTQFALKFGTGRLYCLLSLQVASVAIAFLFIHRFSENRNVA